MTQETLTSFFGWMTVLNFGFLAFTGVMLLVMRDWVSELHARMFALDPADVRATYFRFLASYKILALVLSFVPWLALKLV